ncbi:MAG: 1-acyl-sn-glycerol-3-phosphate acyltransferase [Actinobacteria bacterium]|nr:1-acyl-sn-glycerol-3-phosphate acyltransferase [Actinomycetota bacterium]
MKTHLEYQNGAYRSALDNVSKFGRMFPGFFFYYHMIAIVFRGSQLAKKGLYDNKAWAGSSIGILRAMEKIGTNIEITGVENIEKLDTPCVYIGNHMSTLETFILPNILVAYRNVTFVIKRSLIEFPVFKHIMISRDPVVVGRENPREDLTVVLKEGEKKLHQGTSIIIFPQKTRTVQFNPEEFNTIGIKLARRTRVPIVPLAIKTDAWGQGKLIKDFGKIDPRKNVHFAFGEPMYIQNRGIEEHQRVIKFISDKLSEWNSEKRS